MRIDLHTRCWNDAHMLGFMFRHYDSVVQRYLVYDDGSTDGSIEVLRRHPKVELRTFLPYSNPQSRILSAVTHFDQVWKESRGAADWVIMADVDEHLYHPDLPGYLHHCRQLGVTLIPALGYQMLSPIFPSPDDLLLSQNLRWGAPWGPMSKLGIFSPDAVEDTQYQVGRHSCAPTGRVLTPPRDELLLLHYKYLDLDRTHASHMRSGTRSREIDVASGFGHKYFWTRAELEADWLQIAARLIDVSDGTVDHHTAHTEPRWWSLLPRAS